MTICEICGKNVYRRTRMSDGRLVCWFCIWYLKEGIERVLKDLQIQRETAEKYWGELGKIKSRPTYGSAYSAIPNHWVLEQAMKALNESGNYGPFYAKLAEIYQVESVRSYSDMNGTIVPENAIACYRPTQKEIVSKGKTMTHKTAFHEWFHHLEHQGYVLMDKNMENRQKNADDFANACVAILKGK